MGLSDYIKITGTSAKKNQPPSIPDTSKINLSSGSSMSQKQIIGIALMVLGLAMVGAAIFLW